MADRRITFRVAVAEGEAADAMARDRGYTTVSGRPNVSRLMRDLLAEEINRNPPTKRGSRRADDDPKKEEKKGSS